MAAADPIKQQVDIQRELIKKEILDGVPDATFGSKGEGDYPVMVMFCKSKARPEGYFLIRHRCMPPGLAHGVERNCNLRWANAEPHWRWPVKIQTAGLAGGFRKE